MTAELAVTETGTIFCKSEGVMKSGCFRNFMYCINRFFIRWIILKKINKNRYEIVTSAMYYYR